MLLIALLTPTVEAKGAKCEPLAAVANVVQLYAGVGASQATTEPIRLQTTMNKFRISPCSLPLLFDTASTPQTGPIRARI
jgi:hypothetical protein